MSIWSDEFDYSSPWNGSDPVGPYRVYDNEWATKVDVVPYTDFNDPPFSNLDGNSLRLAVEQGAPEPLLFQVLPPFPPENPSGFLWNVGHVIRVSFDLILSPQSHDFHIAFHGQEPPDFFPYFGQVDGMASLIDGRIVPLAVWTPDAFVERDRAVHIDLIYNHTSFPVEVCCGLVTESNATDMWVLGRRYQLFAFPPTEWLDRPVKAISFITSPPRYEFLLNESYIDNLEIAAMPYVIAVPDVDGDGYKANIDCNDNHPGIFPGATELADGLDNDCNGYVDETTTPSGADVAVQVQASGEANATSATVTFSNVAQPGVTVLTQSTSGTPPPSNFQVTDPPVYFDLSTTAQFTGPVEVCFTYSEPSPNTEIGLRLFHYENGAWQDVTTSLDPDANQICGSVNSFSPFALFHGDSTPPTIHSIAPSADILWPPNHQMIPITLEVNVSDNIDANPTVRIIDVTSNQAQDGLGDGDTAPDWEINGERSLSLRAERGGSATGRVYTITVEAADGSGNRTTAATTVTVPANQKR